MAKLSSQNSHLFDSASSWPTDQDQAAIATPHKASTSPATNNAWPTWFETLLDQTQSTLEEDLLLKTFSALQEEPELHQRLKLQALANAIYGKSGFDIAELLKASPQYSEQGGLAQYYINGCVPTVLRYLEYERNPWLAFRDGLATDSKRSTERRYLKAGGVRPLKKTWLNALWVYAQKLLGGIKGLSISIELKRYAQKWDLEYLCMPWSNKKIGEGHHTYLSYLESLVTDGHKIPLHVTHAVGDHCVLVTDTKCENGIRMWRLVDPDDGSATWYPDAIWFKPALAHLQSINYIYMPHKAVR